MNLLSSAPVRNVTVESFDSSDVRHCKAPTVRCCAPAVRCCAPVPRHCKAPAARQGR